MFRKFRDKVESKPEVCGKSWDTSRNRQIGESAMIWTPQTVAVGESKIKNSYVLLVSNTII